MKRAAAALMPLVLGACMNDVILIADPGATLDPVAFFSGRTAGEGTLHTILGGNSPMRVTSVGRPDGRGGLILTQSIQRGAKAPRERSWTLRPDGAGRFTGQLTDARGEVVVRSSGGKAEIRYTMKNGMKVAQQLALQEDRRTLLNSLSVRKFGLQVARLDETIRKLD